ncbi:MAG: H-X9-DG-CTERM domain-containing protein, partial [Gemmataceae bacterium]
IKDGTSNTIFYTEKLSLCATGSYPDNYWPDWGPILTSGDLGHPLGVASIPQFNVAGSPGECEGGRPSSPHSGGINVALGDGSVRFVGQNVSGLSWWTAMTPASGDVAGTDW